MDASDLQLPRADAPGPDPVSARDGPDDGRLEVVTFGCRLNAYESEVIKAHAGAAGLGDAVVVNTCAVTGEAVRQARQAIRKLRRERPDARIVVTGCAAQIDPQAFAGMAEVDAVVGNQEKMLAETWTGLGSGGWGPGAGEALGDGRLPSPQSPAPRTRVSDIMSVASALAQPIDTFADRVRAHVEVQNGCDHRCTFCIIPFGRGNSRSVPTEQVVAQARRLVENGYQEIVLTGVDITSWGGDLEGAPKLGSLVRAILDAVPELPRLRLSSLDAVEIDPELYDFVVSEPRVAPHLHLSLQAGDDIVLKRMKRRHLRGDAVALCARLRAARPEIAFGADLIAGFPTETDEMFERTLALVDDCGLAYLHVFPFSPRPGTPAARMPQLDRRVVKDRAARLRAEGARALARHLDRHMGTVAEALIEQPGVGRLADFSLVRLGEGLRGAGLAAPGSRVPVRLTGHDGEALIGESAA